MLVELTDVVGCVGATALVGKTIPAQGLGIVLRHASPCFIHQADAVRGAATAQIGCPPVGGQGLCVILRGVEAVLVALPEVDPSLGVTRLG